MSLKFLIIPLLLFLSVSSCSRNKGYFSNDSSRNIDVDQQEPQLLASRSTFIPTQSSFSTPSLSLAIASSNQSIDVQNIQTSSRHSIAKIDVKIQKHLRQKEVVQIIRKFTAQNKRAEKKSGASYWEPRLKIGVTLLVIGIVLSVFGLGLIGGISAFIGLLFTILGLLNTYY